jgi:hypothetical protein
MIEANPRIWGPSQLMLNSGHNLIEAFLIDYDFIKPEQRQIQYKENKLYLWFCGLLSSLFTTYKLTCFQEGKQKLLLNIFQILLSDIYLQPDTYRLFFREFSQEIKSIISKKEVD